MIIIACALSRRRLRVRAPSSSLNPTPPNALGWAYLSPRNVRHRTPSNAGRLPDSEVVPMQLSTPRTPLRSPPPAQRAGRRPPQRPGLQPRPPRQPCPTRPWNVRASAAVEDVVYVGLGLRLAGGAFGRRSR